MLISQSVATAARVVSNRSVAPSLRKTLRRTRLECALTSRIAFHFRLGIRLLYDFAQEFDRLDIVRVIVRVFEHYESLKKRGSVREIRGARPACKSSR